MNVFIVGISGNLGRRLASQLLERGHQVEGLVRNQAGTPARRPEGLRLIDGDLVKMSEDELAGALQGTHVVVFTAGAGGKDGPEATEQVDGDGPIKTAAAARLAGVDRLILVSVFPEAWRERRMPDDFEHYMVAKKRAEVGLVKADIDWVILRPAALTDDPGRGTVDLGIAEVHREIPRDDVAATIVELIERPAVRRVILEVTAGTTPAATAVADLPAPAA